MRVTVKDNSIFNKSSLSGAEKIARKIEDKTLEQLEKEGIFVFPQAVDESKDLTSDQVILRSINENYQTGNIMGFLGLGDERLVISSRFCGQEDYFFDYMIGRVLEFPNLLDMQVSQNQEEKHFNLMVFLFPYYLKSAMRKGVFKKYIRKEYNDQNLSGPIDIVRHIEQNTLFVGKIAYTKREFSHDNYLMELVRHTIEHIKQKPFGRKILSGIKEEVGLVCEATPNYRQSMLGKIINENKRHLVVHAYYREYRALQQLCLMILQHEKHQIGNGSRQIYGILIDGAWLWEEYVNLLVSSKFNHPRNKSSSEAQKLFGGGAGVIYPDFIGKDRNNRIIADAKYKPLTNIAGKDYLQLLAYMFRFDAKLGYYFYPEENCQTTKTLLLNEGTTYENNVQTRADVRVIKQGIQVPIGAQNFDDFCNKMHQSEANFKALFN